MFDIFWKEKKACDWFNSHLKDFNISRRSINKAIMELNTLFNGEDNSYLDLKFDLKKNMDEEEWNRFLNNLRIPAHSQDRHFSDNAAKQHR